MDPYLISVVIPIISSAMTLDGISLIQLPAMRNNMHREAIDQMYGRIMEARIRLENAKNKNKASLVGILTITDLAKLLSSIRSSALTFPVLRAVPRR